MWKLRSHNLLLPKGDATNAECEDAISCDNSQRRYAVADGATEAFDARGWARRLARGWATMEQAPRTVEEFIRWACAEGKAWEEEWCGRSLPWYAAEKRRAGSFAAFVGLTFEERDEALWWRAIAIGDACLVRVRAGRVAGAVPIADYRLFNSTPRLLPSLAADERLNEAEIRIGEGAAETGELFWLLSDAIAQWCLCTLAEQPERFADFQRLVLGEEPTTLVRFINGERARGRLRDDDVAVVRIEPSQ